MSATINVAFMNEFSSSVIHAAQQTESLLWPRVRHDIKTTGNKFFFEILGSVSSQKVTARHSPSVYTPSTHTRTMVYWEDYALGDYMDDADEPNILIDAKGAYQQNFKYAMARDMDSVIITALGGSRWTGVSGTTEVAYDTSTYRIAEGGTGLTELKIRQAKKVIASACDMNMQNESFVLLIGEYQLYTDLLGITEIKSQDYNTVRALVGGTVDTWMGCRVVVHPNLATTGSDRICYVYCESGIGSAMRAQSANAAPDPGHNFNTYLNLRYSLTAGRIQDEKVCQILCLES